MYVILVSFPLGSLPPDHRWQPANPTKVPVSHDSHSHCWSVPRHHSGQLLLHDHIKQYRAGGISVLIPRHSQQPHRFLLVFFVRCLEVRCHQTEGKFIQGEKQKHTHEP